MTLLSIEQIFLRLKYETLPKGYQLSLPVQIKYHDLFNIFSKFDSDEDMLYFIAQITKAPGISVKSTKNNYHIKSLADFYTLLSRADMFMEENHADIPDAVFDLIDKAEFTREQIAQILVYASEYALEKFYLPCKGFKREDLIAIVNTPDNFRKIPSYLMPCLYAHLNPTRNFKPSVAPLLEMAYMAKRAGHIFGLKGNIDFKVGGTPYTFKTDFECAANGLGYLCYFLDAYTKTNNSATLLAIAQAFNFAKDNIEPNSNYYKTGSAAAFLARYIQNELVYFTAGWDGHSVGIALFGDYLIYSNRGTDGDPVSGCKIYKLRDRKLITHNFIVDLKKASYDTAQEFHDVLKQVIDMDRPVVAFPCKGQKYSTCSFVNPKSAIEAMIVLYQAGAFATDEELQTQFQQEASRSTYKKLTAFIRDHEIDNLLERMQNETNDNLLGFYGDLAKMILTQHHGQRGFSDKDWEEFDRACYFYNNIPAKLKILMLFDEDFEEIINELESWREEDTVEIDASLSSTQQITFQFNNLSCAENDAEKTPSIQQNITAPILVNSI